MKQQQKITTSKIPGETMQQYTAWQLYCLTGSFDRLLVAWQGFRVGEIKITHVPRRYGQSKYGWVRYLRAFFDLFTVVFLIRFLKRPLHFFGLLGIVFFLSGLLVNIYLVGIWFSGEAIGRRPLLILGVLLMIIGFQFISTGLLAEMIVHFGDDSIKKLPVSQKIGGFLS